MDIRRLLLIAPLPLLLALFARLPTSSASRVPLYLEAIRADLSPVRIRTNRLTKIVRVRSLDDSGPGTLRSCAAMSGSRICIFEVAGAIFLRSPIRITQPHIFIAGETAPSPGITLTGSGIRIESHDVQLQHLAIRPGDSLLGAKPSERDGVSVGVSPPAAAHHVHLDHLSLTWAIDENFSTWYPGTRGVSLTNSIIAEGLYDSIHPKGPHSKGALIGARTTRILMRGNLLAFNEERNPYIEPGASVTFINNLVYGWGPRGPWSACNLTNNDHSDLPVIAAMVGNVFIPGPFSFREKPPIFGKHIAPTSVLFVRDNLGTTRQRDGEDDSRITSLSPPVELQSSCPFHSGCRAALRANQVEAYVLQRAGSRPAERSAIDHRIVEQVRNRTGDLKDCTVGCERETGALPNHSSTRRLLATPPRPFSDDDRDGLTNFEEWLRAFTMQAEGASGPAL